jgi:ABC-2 type transport system permease protein
MLFPVVLTLVFGTSFGAMGSAQPLRYKLGLVNLDSEGPYPRWSQNFLGNLTNLSIFDIQYYPDNETAQADLVQGKVQAVLIIPPNFGESCNSFSIAPTQPSLWINTSVSLYLDGGSIFATQAVLPIVQQILTMSVHGELPELAPSPVHIGSPSLIISSKLSMFDYMAPGIFTYAAIFITMTVAQSFATDRENGLLRRINITPTTSAEFMTSQAISNMVVALMQVALVFATAYLIGYRPNNSAFGFALAFAIVSIFALCNVGFGLIAATLAKSSGSATGLSFIFIMPQMILGTFVGAALSSTAQAIGKFVPSYYVTDALTSLLLRGAPTSSPAILLDLAVVSLSSAASLIFGILTYQKYGKS